MRRFQITLAVMNIINLFMVPFGIYLMFNGQPWQAIFVILNAFCFIRGIPNFKELFFTKEGTNGN